MNAMVTQTDCYVSGVIAAVLRVGRFVGVSPLHFVKKKSGWRVSVSRGWSIYGYIIVTITILTTIAATIGDMHVEPNRTVRMRTNTHRVVWIVDASLMIVIAGISVYGAPSQMKSMIACLNRVQKINCELYINHWPMYSERKKISLFVFWMSATVIITCVDHVTLTITNHLDTSETWISWLYSFYYCCYWILQIREILFIVVTLHVKYTLKAVNDNLRKLLRVTEIAQLKNLPLTVTSSSRLLKVGKKVKRSLFNNCVNSVADSSKLDSDGITNSTRSHHETVHHLAQSYSSTCDVVRDIDQSHGILLLIMLGSFVLHLVATSYYFINNLLDDNISQNVALHIASSVVQLFWCLYHVSNLLMVIEPCHLTHMEMEMTRELVSHLMRCTHSVYDPLAVELELFFRLLILNDSSYSPMQVTKISRTLVATILGSITTYLVIIVQL